MKHCKRVICCSADTMIVICVTPYMLILTIVHFEYPFPDLSFLSDYVPLSSFRAHDVL